MKPKGCMYFFFGIFAAAGLLCGVLSLGLVYQRYQITSGGIHTKGRVVDLLHSKSSVAPVVSYLDEQGVEHLYESSSYTSINAPGIGDTLSVYYRPGNPEDVELEGEGWFNLFPLIFFFTHGGVGFGGLYWLEKKRRMYNWLKQNGHAIEAKLVEIRHGAHKGRSYYTLRCEWKDPYTQELYHFESESLSQDPSGRLPTGSTVGVLIDPDKPKRYMMDVSFLDT